MANSRHVPLTDCILLPTNFLTDYPGQVGLSVQRTAAGTCLLAISLALLGLTPSPLMAGLVIPLWAGTAGVIVDGQRGLFRGILYAIVYPIYAGVVVSVCFGVYWLYANLHQEIWQFAR